MIRYTEDKKTAVLKRMMPPESSSVARLSIELGISESCLYYWRMKAKQKSALMPDSKQPPEQWSSAHKFTVVLETARITETELSTYCRKKGLFVEQVKMWRQICEDANLRTEKVSIDSRKESKIDKQRLRPHCYPRNRLVLALATENFIPTSPLTALWRHCLWRGRMPLPPRQ